MSILAAAALNARWPFTMNETTVMFNYTKFKQLVLGTASALSFAELHTELQRIREREELSVRLPNQFRNNLAVNGVNNAQTRQSLNSHAANDDKSALSEQFDKSIVLLAVALIALAYGICIMRLADFA
jgi:hypothetical protein